ncbi:gamma-glutamylcyclotransferase [Roseixanthobacter liquoris]|uniref:gamma-glutamylcyclotransferase n=1 Tax=Roseixanthobacter liquoris TaxID=3119921 RepID=UPI0037263CB9
MQRHILTRELIETDGIDAIAARDAPTLRILSPSERATSLRETLAERPEGDVWLFGYGSLIWNPSIQFAERRTARVEGWHRAFCLSALVGRGSMDNPGLVLGLDEGGSCAGVAFRIAEKMLEAELSLVWKREMLAAAYVPRWVDVRDDAGARFGNAIAFTIDKAGRHYAGGLPENEAIQRIATASGALGSSADYLFQTCEGLRAHGIPDTELEELAARVAAVQAAAAD